jgi:4-aminobutyrate aminotransferase-like enzyme
VTERAYYAVSLNFPQEQALLARRRRVMGEKMKLFFDPRPQHFVRGSGMELYDGQGKRYLDFYNNVVAVGHCHPFVAGVLARQARRLNTNTRYLGDETIQFAEQVLSTLHPSLDSIVFCNSGSEANDIAYRLCKAVTGHRGGLTVRHAYHGITDAMTAFTPALSPNSGQPHVIQLEPPHDYQGPYRRSEHSSEELGRLYASTIDEPIARLQREGYGVACAIADSLFMSNGVLDAPKGYLASLCAKTQAAGGFYIADEVQAGYNRCGETMWGHQRHGVIPDIVTIGKPAGNGHPLSALIMRKDMLARFSASTSFFSTFGGNNVSCAVGLAVLQVMREENLRENAKTMGALFKKGLEELKDRYQVVGDVRGVGLALGVEFVRNRETREPDNPFCQEFLRRLRDNGVVSGSDGEFQNCVKLRPPLVVQKQHVEFALDAFDKTLRDMTATFRQ